VKFGPGWEIVLAARAGNYDRKPMNIQLDRRAEGAGGVDVKFALQIQPLDHTHTHGELERCDKKAVMAVLAKAADEIVNILRRVEVRDHRLPPMPLPASLLKTTKPS